MPRRNNFFKRKFKFIKKSTQAFVNKHKKIVIFIILCWFFLLAAKLAYNHYINNPKNTITNIYFSKQIVNNPNFLSLTKETNDFLSGKNLVKEKISGFSNLKEYIKNKFPYVSKINIEIINNKSVKIDFKFQQPLIEFIWSWKNFLVYWENKIYPFNSLYFSWLNFSWLKLYLPWYINKTNPQNLNLIFWKSWLKKIYLYTKIIHKNLPNCKIYFLPGAEYFKVFCKQKIYLFSLKKDIKKQFNQLKLLKIKIPDKISTAKEIDLGSLDNQIFIK